MEPEDIFKKGKLIKKSENPKQPLYPKPRKVASTKEGYLDKKEKGN